MTHSLILIAGLGILMGSSAMAQEKPAAAIDMTQAEVAPETSVAPLGTPNARSPRFVLLSDDSPTEMTVGTSGLLAFGTEGIRLPAYERDIPTGSVTLKR